MKDDITDDEAIDAYMQYMIDEKVLMLDGIGEDGEPVYKVDIDKAEIIAPEFAKAYLLDTENTVIDLYQEGLVDMSITDDGEVLYHAVKQND